MNFTTDNLLCFHLNLFNTYDQVEKMIEDRSLENFDPNILWNYKIEGYLKVWLDCNSYDLVFWTQKGEKKGTICINVSYLLHLKNMKSVCYDRKPHFKLDSESKSNQELNQALLDIILDKILNQGVESLNSKEREFLEKYSG
jgi:hypothetical protein